MFLFSLHFCLATVYSLVYSYCEWLIAWWRIQVERRQKRIYKRYFNFNSSVLVFILLLLLTKKEEEEEEEVELNGKYSKPYKLDSVSDSINLCVIFVLVRFQRHFIAIYSHRVCEWVHAEQKKNQPFTRETQQTNSSHLNKLSSVFCFLFTLTEPTSNVVGVFHI